MTGIHDVGPVADDSLSCVVSTRRSAFYGWIAEVKDTQTLRIEHAWAPDEAEAVKRAKGLLWAS